MEKVIYPFAVPPRGTRNRQGPASRAHKAIRGHRCGRQPRPRSERWGVRRSSRPLRLWEDDDPPNDRGARVQDRRGDLHRRPRGERPRPPGTEHRDGVPVVCAVSPHDGLQEHGLPPRERKGPGGGDCKASQQDRETPADRKAAWAEAGAVERWTASARRPRPGACEGAARVPHGRATEQPRRETSRAYASRTEAAPEGHWGYDDLRHARPDRGDDDGESHRPPRRGKDSAVRVTERDVQPSRQPF